jgi:hypothetical protein
MSRRRAKQLAAAVLVAVALAVVAIVATAGAHTPATFVFGKLPATITSKAIGTASESHHVIFIPGLKEITCTGAEFEGQTSTSPTVSFRVRASYGGCQSGSEDVIIGMGSCEYAFNANGEVSISSKPGEDCEQFPIQIVTKSGCEVRIREQTLPGVGYTNLNTTGTNPDVTIGMSMTKITGTRGGGCVNPGTFTTGEYTTGNTVVYAEEAETKKLISMEWEATVP